MITSKKNSSLSDNIAFLLSSCNDNSTVDPEDDIYTETKACVDEFEIENDGPAISNSSLLRKSNIHLLGDLDKKYRGGVISRKEVEGHFEDDQEDSDISDGLESNTDYGGDTKNATISAKRDGNKRKDVSSSEIDESSEESENEEDENQTDDMSSGEDDKNDFQTLSKRDSDLEVQKGISVRNQLTMWDSLIECRIQLQKVLLLSNQLPQYDVLREFRAKGGLEFTTNSSKARQNLSKVLNTLLDMQEKLLNSYPETKDFSKKKSKISLPSDEMAEEIPSSDEEREQSPSSEDECSEKQEPTPAKKRKADYASILASRHDNYVSYRNATIQKWNSKTQIGASNFSRNFSAFEQSTLKQIEHILADRPRLRRRTQLRRSNYHILGQVEKKELNLNQSSGENMKSVAEASKEYSAEIFDDSDFYHQLLRELIERRSADVTDPVQLGRQWIELQKMRNKMKRKIDVKATKGRRIRYTVHEKLVNYMAPQPTESINEEAKTELYNSLFGKRKL